MEAAIADLIRTRAAEIMDADVLAEVTVRERAGSQWPSLTDASPFIGRSQGERHVIVRPRLSLARGGSGDSDPAGSLGPGFGDHRG